MTSFLVFRVKMIIAVFHRFSLTEYARQPLKVAAVACLIFVGCSDGRPSRVPVSGRVTIDGAPATSGSIQFLSQVGTGRPSAAKIQPDGRFSIFTFEENDGCPLGIYDVVITSMEELSETQMRYNLPKKYGNRKTSGIVKTIDGPTDSLNIELTWEGKKGPIVEAIE
jgi:hypothetical protein